MFKTSIRCDHCKGFIVSPSGMANIEIVLTAGLFVVYGEKNTAWIGARNEDQAFQHFMKKVEPDCQAITKMNGQEMDEAIFCIDPTNEGNEEEYIWLSGREIITLSPKLPAIYIVLENDMILKAKEKKDNDYS
ncbi:hypothetical protein [Bacillus sp. V5-8f]|uniref:hypothetical protein n=1 Tax=Bacillus sp. V5-8f TaxID=2053044 RepID=UPI000C78D979|nr:hypothetical protein [Bacillus sp. V5-8f]PLT32073.1 hypothetical protein CUU64_21130 [Bacillus sp. V5-8f]